MTIFNFAQVSKPSLSEWANFKHSMIHLFYAEEFENLSIGDGNCDEIEIPMGLFESESTCGTAEMLVVNGVDGEDCEPLIIKQMYVEKGEVCCQTNGRPYTQFVQSALLVASKTMKQSFRLLSDKDCASFSNAMDIVTKSTGIEFSSEDRFRFS